MASRRFGSAVWWLCLTITLLSSAAAGLYVYLADVPKPTPLVAAAASEAKSDDLPLDENQRGFLWDVEHHGLSLGRYGFKPFADALSRGDRAALAGLLAADFVAQTLRQPREVRATNDFVRVVRQEDSGQTPRPLNRDALLDLLLDYRKPFGQPPKVQLALMALTPMDRDQLEGPWQGTGQLRLWGETQPGQPREVVLNVSYRIDQPSEENLTRGGWLHMFAISQVLVGDAPRFLFREVAAERGIDVKQFHDNWFQSSKPSNTGGVYVCDFDRDGILDLLITDVNRYALYKGLADGKFQDVTEALGIPVKLPYKPLALVAAFVDLDGDGWEDLILGDQVYRNDQGKRFVNVTSRCNLRLPEDCVGVAVADYDRDGKVDLYAVRPGKTKSSSWVDGKSGDTKGNQLWRNLGNWQFEDVTAKAGADGGQRSTFTAVWLDANNDGWPDLHVPNEFGNGVLLVNNGDGTFRPQPLGDGPVDFGSMGAAAGDVDNDGNIDLYVANMYSKAGNRVMGNVCAGTYPDELMRTMKQFVAGSQLHRNRGGLKFEQKGKDYQIASIGWAYGPALADFDNDGFLDLYATAGFISQSRTEPDG